MAKKKVEFQNFTDKKTTQVKPDGLNKRWWLASKDEMPQAITNIVTYLEESDSQRQTQYQTSVRLYGNVNILGLSGLSASKVQTTKAEIKDRVTYNVIQSAVDTITAKMAKNKPKPLFLTSGGDYKAQRKAKKLDKFVEGILYENKAHALGVDIFRDSAIKGDGVVHVYDSNGSVKLERTPADELYVDWVEAFNGDPRQLHRVKLIDRDILIEEFPEHKSDILDAKSSSADMVGAYQNVADQVTVCESWRLPSGPEAKDGIHVITLEDKLLFTEPWTRDHFPFAFLKWCKRVNGFWAQGIPEQIQSTQLEINKLLWVMQRSMHLMGTFKVWIKNGSKIVKEHLNNEIGTIISSDEQPVYITPNAIPPEYFQRLQSLKDEAFQQIGVSMLSAASQKPEGLDSGKALREFNNIESDRFMVIGQAYEQFFMDITKLVVETARNIYERTGELSTKVPGKKFIETIDWKDVNLEDDEFVMKVFPVSSLPNEPAGRLQTIQEYVQAGFISPRAARRLLDFPDLEQIEELGNAQENWIHETLEKIIDDGKYTPPDPAMDFALAKEIAIQYYAEGQTNGLEEKKLDLLRQFNTQLDILTQKAMPPPMPMGPGGAQAIPNAPPVSDMLPNAPGGVAA